MDIKDIIERGMAEYREYVQGARQFEKLNRPDAPQKLSDALIEAAECESLIKPEQDKLQRLIDIATGDVERRARIYQHWLVKVQLERAAYWAKERIKHMAALTTAGKWEIEHETCRADTLYWFRWWAWSIDPRPNVPLKLQPFVPFDFQERYIRWIERTTFEFRTSGLVEKSRDMGATVGWLCWCVKQWRYMPRFSALLSTVDEDLVDSKKDPDTLFEKIRLQIRMLPEEMLPKGFDLARDMPYMNIANPQNDAVITGEAPTDNIGRQRRRTVALFDEFASWRQGGYPQNTSASMTVPSIFKVSSVKGRQNKFADERHSGYANVFEMDWRVHPWKTQDWYDSLPYGLLGPVMTKVEIAQEVDRNYDSSQPGRVFRDYNEIYHVITWSEFCAVVPGARNLVTQAPKIPDDWLKACGLDWGATSEEEHPAAMIWVTRAAENAPLCIRDSVFVYRERLWGNGPTVAEVAREIRAAELVENERIDQRRLSHERSTEQNTFLREHHMTWAKWQTGENWGISVINDYLEIDWEKQHPFRPFLGKPRMFLIVADGEGELIEEADGRKFVVAAQSQEGLKRLRAEMPVFHYPESEKGKSLREMRPLKFFDDCVSALRGISGHWFIGQRRLTDKEREEEALPENLRMKNISDRAKAGQMSNDEFNTLWRMRQSELCDVRNAAVERNLIDRMLFPSN